MKKKLSTAKTVVILLAICALIAIIPLLFIPDSSFSGSDDAAEDAITEIDPSYHVWASPVMEPPGSETESLLFCLQAAIGAGVFGYGLGVLRERSRMGKKEND